jgi:signal transduction histidine kinase
LFRSVRYEPNYLPISRDRKSWSTVLPPQRAQVFSEFTPSTIGNILITVTDSGPGLSEEQQHKLFREGVQFNPNELQAGQGSG